MSLSNIRNVAVYERKTLLRSWFFRIFFLIALFIMVMFNLGFFIIPGAANWNFRALPGNIPLLNVMFVIIAQSIIDIFLASDFLKRDKKLDTAEVIYTRAISNSEYVIGKTWGVLSVFVGMTLFFLVLALVFNLIVKDTSINWMTYLYYPILITIPTLIFILGFSYALMLLIKNQAVTFLVLLGYVAITLFYFGDKFYGIFDYMAFFTPMPYSEITGFGDPFRLLIHRGFYFLVGLSFILLTINRFNRLPNNNISKPLYLVLFIMVFTGGAAAGIYHWQMSQNEFLKRKLYLKLNNENSHHSRLKVNETRLFIDHKSSKLSATATLVGSADKVEPSDTLVFTLNPGLSLNNVVDGAGKNVDYTRTEQTIQVVKPNEYITADSLVFTFEYNGRVDEAFCYLDIDREEYETTRAIGPMRLDERFAYLSGDFLMLTPETFWYPVAGVGYNVNTIKTQPDNFSMFQMEVKTNPGFTIVTQGKKQNGSNRNIYITDTPLKNITLVAGKLDTLSITVDSVEYNLYYLHGNDFFTQHLPNLKDTIGYIIEDEMSRYNNQNFMDVFPFNKVDIVEVPGHFQYYQRKLENTFETVQPGMILYPERALGMRMADFSRIMRFEGRDRNNGDMRQIDKEVNVFRRFIGRTFLNNSDISQSSSGRRFSDSPIAIERQSFTLNPFSLYPMYVNHVNAIVSDEYPLTDMIFSNYMRQTNVFDFGAMRGGMREEERANILLQEKTLDQILANPKKKDLIPTVISQKGSFLVYGLKHSAGITNFDDFLYFYMLDHRFKAMPLDSLKAEFYKAFEVDISPFLALVANKEEIPSFKVGQARFTETRDDIGPVYLVTVKVTNESGVKGILDVNFRAGRTTSNNEERIYLFEPNETKELQMMLFDMPRMMTINTVISKNIPASYNVFIQNFERNINVYPEEFEQTVEDPVSYYNDNEYVVDNEDEGFSLVQENTETKIKQYFDKLKNEDEPRYGSVNPNWAPHYWRSVAHTAFNGSVIKSAYYTRDGSGERTATWKTALKNDGVYDVYVYIP